MKTHNILFALLAVFLIGFVSCTKKPVPQVVPKDAFPYPPQTEVKVVNEDSILMAAKLENKRKVDANHTAILQSIIKGDCDALAAVTHFPIWRPYPEKDIANKEELKALFHVFFDDKIRRDLKRFTAADWELVGWRGYMLNNGIYFWSDEDGYLRFINYETPQLRAYRNKLWQEERQNLNESKQWKTIDCLLSTDSTIFLRLEEWDEIQRLHVFTHDSIARWRHMIFHGTMESQGSCGNDVYWYASYDGLITVFIDAPRCYTWHGIMFPKTFNLPEYLQGQTIRCKRTQWREVKKWW